MIRKTTIQPLLLALTFAALTAGVALAQPEIYQEGQRALRTQQWERAAEMFREAVREDPEHADAALYWQGYALAKAGRERQARKALKQLQRKYPDSQWVDDARTLLVDLGESIETDQPGQDTSVMDDELRLYVISQLMDRDPERAMPRLMEMLEQAESDEVRRQALFVLGISDAEEAQRKIADFARNSADRTLQMEAIHMLGAAGSDDSVALLQEIYADVEAAEVRRTIIHAYVAADAEQALLAALRQTEEADLQRAAIHALGAMDAQSALRDLYLQITEHSSRAAVIEALAIAEDSEALMNVLASESDRGLRRSAIHGLAISDSEDSARFLKSIYQNSASSDEKRAVLEALFILDEAADIVLEILNSESDPNLKRRAIEALGVMEATDQLHGLYQTMDDVELRASILQSMAIAEDIDGLIRVLDSETDTNLRRTAIQSLAISDEDRAADYLVDFYPRANTVERQAILQAMLIMDNVEGLIGIMGMERDPDMRREVLKTLALIDSDEASDYLLELMESDR